MSIFTKEIPADINDPELLRSWFDHVRRRVVNTHLYSWNGTISNTDADPSTLASYVPDAPLWDGENEGQSVIIKASGSFELNANPKTISVGTLTLNADWVPGTPPSNSRWWLECEMYRPDPGVLSIQSFFYSTDATADNKTAFAQAGLAASGVRLTFNNYSLLATGVATGDIVLHKFDVFLIPSPNK